MKVAFAGTPEFAASALEAILAAGFEVPLVLTQPDRPAGRGMKLKASPVKTLALAHGLTPYARGEAITILRRSEGKERRIPISYPLLASGKRPEMNLYLLRGDVVIVP
mgnify:CR=1 FL=1